MKFLKFRLLLVAFVVSVVSLSAQDMREKIAQDPNYAGSNLLSYIYKPTVHTPAPKGYKPFYISTYGRHGSRWHTRPSYYKNAIRYFANAEQQNALTDLGKEVYERLKVIHNHADGHEGMLTTKGVAEHRGIAERMVQNYPEIFSTKGHKECHIECLSTLYPRCILSMAANNERIKELNPQVHFTRTTGDEYKAFLSNTVAVSMIGNYTKAETEKITLRHYTNPDRFVHSLFKPEYVAAIDKYDAMLRIFYIAIILQNHEELEVSLYDIFTPEELYNLWQYRNMDHYITFGYSEEFGDYVAADAIPLMRHIIADVDDALANGGRSGFLRFGHDMIVVPLICFLQMEGRCQRLSIFDFDKVEGVWQDINITSMAANVQMVFYRNKQGEVLVKVLHNEAEVRLPLKSDHAPYYRWDDFRGYYLDRIDKLSKLETPEVLVKYKNQKPIL
ncbi:MAG: histidine-type phosphatase [Alistipes sp.]|nr:histidine-type phosphatase [Alistipes sp.]